MSGIYSIPNVLTVSRIMLCPVLLTLAVLGKPEWFLVLFAVALATDFFDGLIARLLHQKTELGAHLDSIADASIWAVFIVSVLLLWPEKCLAESGWMIAGVVAFVVPGVMGLIRYHIVVGLHTWSAKCAMATMGVGVLLRVAEISHWPFHVAILILVWAAIEETTMMVLLKEPRTDVPSVFHAFRLRKQS